MSRRRLPLARSQASSFLSLARGHQRPSVACEHHPNDSSLWLPRNRLTAPVRRSSRRTRPSSEPEREQCCHRGCMLRRLAADRVAAHHAQSLRVDLVGRVTRRAGREQAPAVAGRRTARPTRGGPPAASRPASSPVRPSTCRSSGGAAAESPKRLCWTTRSRPLGRKAIRLRRRCRRARCPGIGGSSMRSRRLRVRGSIRSTCAFWSFAIVGLAERRACGRRARTAPAG